MHIHDLKALFVFAPNITIKEHLIRFGTGAAIGAASALGMMTVGHWTNGRMDHELLYWSNGDFMKQIGRGP